MTSIPSKVIHCLNGGLVYAFLTLGLPWQDGRIQQTLDWQARAILGEEATFYASGTTGPGFAPCDLTPLHPAVQKAVRLWGSGPVLVRIGDRVFEDNDVLSGGEGSDLIVAGAGDDYILGDTDYVPTFQWPVDANNAIDPNAWVYSMNGSNWYHSLPSTFDWSITPQADGGILLPPGYEYAPGNSPAAGSDIVYAGDGADQVWAGSGGDVVYGEGGADMLDGEDGNDILFGGTGDDVLYGDGNTANTGADYLDGGEGADTLWGGNGDDVLAGGIGDDKLYGEYGANYLDGGDGNDILNSGGPGSVLDGGADNDILSGDAGADSLIAGAGVDNLSGGADNDTIVLDVNLTAADSIDGGTGTDTLTFTSSGDANALTLVTNVENVTLNAAGAPVSLNLFAGNSTGVATLNLDASALNQDLTLDASLLTGNLNFTGSALTDSVTGSNLGDTLSGGTGDDTLTGGSLGDVLNGEDGADVLSGLAGADTLSGGAGNDSLVGGIGADSLVGGTGDDTLDGGADNDVLTGAAGNDSLTAGSGNDNMTIGGVCGEIGYEARRSGRQRSTPQAAALLPSMTRRVSSTRSAPGVMRRPPRASRWPPPGTRARRRRSPCSR